MSKSRRWGCDTGHNLLVKIVFYQFEIWQFVCYCVCGTYLLFALRGNLMEGEALLNALRDCVACYLPFSWAKKVQSCFHFMGNGSGIVWEHSQWESEMKGRNMRKNYITMANHVSWEVPSHHHGYFYSLLCCHDLLVWYNMSKVASGHQAYAFRTENEIILWTFFPILNICFNSSPKIQ